MEYCAYCGSPVPAVSYEPCPKCGNPTNGAPRPPVARTGQGPGLIIIIVLAVLTIPAIIGILAAIAVPNFLTAMQRSKQKRTMADIRSIVSAAEAYATDNNSYPRTLDELVPKYMARVPRVDGWGHGFDYQCVAEEAERCTAFAIRSGGKDVHVEVADLREAASQEARATRNFDCDIIYSHGQFVEYPEGVSH